ncbi:acetate/propionate family kinase [Candidatus Poribacteria bacterium]|nr:acetate/propionate family kinase [Candidatus Poribacteria bacterium]
MYILVINAGSSSVKYKLFDMKGNSVIAEGIVDRIGLEDAFLKHQTSNAKETKIDSDIDNYDKALKLITDILVDKENGVIDSLKSISAVGHRVVHGGEKASSSVLITPEVEEIIKECFDLAPLHNPPNMMGIEACKKILPHVPQVAVFDTAFHRTIPEKAYLYAIPYALYENYSIRRYGFHGTSHRYVASRACEILGKPEDKVKMITCHLGSGCSITAIKDGKSVDTSMGFTPLEGLIMGTRSGDIDPAIIFYLVERVGLSVSEVNNMLNKQSGLLGLSTVSRDMRDLEQEVSKGNKKAQISIECFAYRIRKYIGAYASAMAGLDVVVFTAGIGENSSKTRAMICDGMDFLDMKLDSEKNSQLEGEGIVSRDDSGVKILVIPTDEELMIARDTMEIAQG